MQKTRLEVKRMKMKVVVKTFETIMEMMKEIKLFLLEKKILKQGGGGVIALCTYLKEWCVEDGIDFYVVPKG